VECKDTHGRRRINDLVRMMDRFNEIPPEDYIPLNCGTSPNPKATFRMIISLQENPCSKLSKTVKF